MHPETRVQETSVFLNLNSNLKGLFWTCWEQGR